MAYNDNSKKDILFSREVKAGKRIYYIDVKNDRNGDYYISLTESKRIKAGSDFERPVFEKHKVFFYMEDVAKIRQALDEVIQFATESANISIAPPDIDDFMLNSDL